MKIEEVLALLEKKCQGKRKDGLMNIASNLAMVAQSQEQLQPIIDALTEEAVDSAIRSYRSVVDAENTRAAQTREEKLRETYSFVDKTQPKPEPSKHADTPKPVDPTSLTMEQFKSMLADAVKPFADEINAMKLKGVNDARRAQVEAILKEVAPQYKEAVLDGFSGRQFKDDTEFQNYLQDQQTKATEMRAANKAEQLDAFGMPKLPRNSDGVSSAVANFLKDQQGKGTVVVKGREL